MTIPAWLESIICELQYQTEHANHNQPMIDKVAEEAAALILSKMEEETTKRDSLIKEYESWIDDFCELAGVKDVFQLKEHLSELTAKKGLEE